MTITDQTAILATIVAHADLRGVAVSAIERSLPALLTAARILSFSGPTPAPVIVHEDLREEAVNE